MTDKAWKSTERAIARRLGGKRNPINGRGDEPDVVAPGLSVETKERRSLPKWLYAFVAQAVKSARKGDIPIVILHELGRHHDSDLVVLRLRDFEEVWHARRVERNNEPV